MALKKYKLLPNIYGARIALFTKCFLKTVTEKTAKILATFDQKRKIYSSSRF